MWDRTGFIYVGFDTPQVYFLTGEDAGGVKRVIF